DENPVGAAGRDHDHRARQRPLSVAAPAPAEHGTGTPRRRRAGMSRSAQLWQIFRGPLAIAVLSVVGLLAALVADGWMDVVSWVALAVPPLVIVWALSRQPEPVPGKRHGRRTTDR